jgi:hypothetical protein
MAVKKEAATRHQLEQKVRTILDRLEATKGHQFEIRSGTHPYRETNWVVEFSPPISETLAEFAVLDVAIAELQVLYIMID